MFIAGPIFYGVRIVDLASQGEDSSGMPLHIAKGLDHGDYGVNLAGMGL